jgi:two-component system chemotaxis sensor kinase CheA
VCALLLEGADAAREMLPDALAGIDQLRPAATEVLRKLQQLTQSTPPEPTPASLREEIRPAAGGGTSRPRTVRVEVEKLDRMVDLIGEIAVGRGRIVQQVRERGGPGIATLLEEIEQNERLYAELEDVIRTARVVPIGPWLQQYGHAIREIARHHGKEVRLVVAGGDVEADMAMIEGLRDPFTHLIRNAIDHGIEPPEVRKQRGKDPAGTITLSAWYEGRGIVLRIADDGAGLSHARIAAEARARGLALDPESLPTEELHRLVFEHGFSTASFVSDLSGRGMGLAVVRQRIEALRGLVRIESTEGHGASFMIRLPLTLATIEGLSVGAGGECYVIPLEAVVECIDLPEGALASDQRSVLNLRGRVLPCAYLRELMGFEGPTPPRQSVVVVGHEGGLGGLVVDELHGEGRTVIKPLGQLFRGIPGVAGSTILGDGRVALILDVATLLGDVAPRLSRVTSMRA